MLRELPSRRAAARGAFVVVLPDGWECGGPEPFAARMRGLHRPAHRVIRAEPYRNARRRW
ncbi:VWA domain-containing protein [Streptomyces sp. NPDC005303]|uniref:VWA domain-containing protein n=1 Tax=Streptomyces sp. NPDC005303 TaxID=3155713 RepID=UPI00339EE511